MVSFNAEQRFIGTGASSGIGEGVALLLNELGASVIGIGRNKERLNALKSKCKHPEKIFLEVKELTEDIPRLPAYIKALKEKYGKFSGMAYCAGISSVIPIRQFEYDEAKRIYDVNYFSPMFMTKGMVDKRNNVGYGTSLVYISSIDAEIASKGQPQSTSRRRISRTMTQPRTSSLELYRIIVMLPIVAHLALECSIS